LLVASCVFYSTWSVPGLYRGSIKTGLVCAIKSGIMPWPIANSVNAVVSPVASAEARARPRRNLSAAPNGDFGGRRSRADLLNDGAVKKLVITGHIAPHVNLIYGPPTQFDGFSLLLGTMGYATARCGPPCAPPPATTFK